MAAAAACGMISVARIRRISLIVCWITASQLFTCAVFFSSPQVMAQEVVIVNPLLEAKSQLSLNAVRAIFGMRLRTWPDGTPVKVFVLPADADTHIKFSKKILQVFPHQLSQAWDRLVFSGTGQAPVVVKSQKDMRAKVAETPGAIGYLLNNMIDDSVHQIVVGDNS